MALFNNTPMQPTVADLQELISSRIESIQSGKGIAAKPEKVNASKEDLVLGYFREVFNTTQEKADSVREDLAPTMETLARESALLNAQEREAAGITQSLVEGGGEAYRKKPPEGTITRPVARPDELVTDTAKDVEESAPVTVETESAGLMSDPRNLGGAEGYGKLTKNIVEGTDKEELKETQSRLKALGFYESAVDGLTGPSTKSAIKTFQHKNRLEVTGIADEPTRLKLAQPEGLVAQEKPKRTLLSFISKGEGGYGAANNGTSKLAKKFSVIDGYYSDTYNKPLTEMTVNELMNAQVGTTGKTTEELLSIDPESTSAQRNRDVFAVGAYQIIPKTMWAAVREGAIDGDTIFEPKVQDKIAIDFLAGSDRPMLQAFLAGKTKVTIGKKSVDVTVEDAMLDLAKQWASAPAPKDMTTSGGRKIKKGKSYYGSGNKAQHSVEETKAMLLQARDENIL